MHASQLAQFTARRQRVFDQLGDDVLVLFAAPVALRNNDVDFEYRQDSDFFYLTGFEEPESVLVLKGGQTVLFVRPRDKERETWEGRRAGVEGAVELFGADTAYSVSDLQEHLPDLFENVSRVHSLLTVDGHFDPRIMKAAHTVRGRRRRRVEAPREFVDASHVIHEMRLIKEPSELDLLRKAAQITAAGHCRAMSVCRPGMSEFELQIELETEFRKRGSRRLAYSSIVGGGDNATILHYRENDRILRDGDLVLIDAGAEYEYYAADVTRTFPVNGKFSELQRRAYELVLRSQEAAIAHAMEGNTVEGVHDAALSVLADGFVELGLVSATSSDRRKDATRYYMHRTSHYLGMDVHDVGPYHRKGSPLTLKAGMVITVEPGLYVATDDLDAPAELRGLGIRIEDDIAVTPGAPEVLTQGVPKAVDEIEALCRACTDGSVVVAVSQ